MDDLISRQDAIDALKRDEEYDEDIPNRSDGVRDAIITISNLPTADVAERKKGTWKRKPEFLWQGYECSLCGYEIASRTNYCSNCGADMRKEVK